MRMCSLQIMVGVAMAFSKHCHFVPMVVVLFVTTPPPFTCALSQMPEDLADLDPETQQFHVKMRAAYLMTLGTALVLTFAGKPRGGPFRG